MANHIECRIGLNWVEGENLDAFVAEEENALYIAKGIQKLNEADLSSEANLAAVVSGGRRASTVAKAIVVLNKANLLSEENLVAVTSVGRRALTIAKAIVTAPENLYKSNQKMFLHFFDL